MKVGLILPHDPRREMDGTNLYPSLLFYLGTFIEIVKLLGGKLDIIHLKEGSSKFHSNDCDFHYLKKNLEVGKVIHYKSITEDYDVMISAILVGYDDCYYRYLNEVVGKCKHFIYMDGDTEPLMNVRTTLFSKIDELALHNIFERLSIVYVTESNLDGRWDELLGRDVEVFVPYISHPYYIRTNRIRPNTARFYDIASMKSAGRHRKMHNMIMNANTNDLVKGSYRFIPIDELSFMLSTSKCLLGTIATNLNPGCYRSSSKIMEALHSGLLPTVIPYQPTKGRYPYHDEIPPELKILLRPESVEIQGVELFLNYVKNISDDDRINLVNKLYELVYDYHNPTNWVDTLEKSLEVVK